MATKTRDISPLVKGKRNPNTSKTQSLVVTNAINLIASNRKNIYLKSKVSSSHQGKKPTPSTSYANIHHKQTLRTSIDKPQSSFDKRNPTLLSNDPNIVESKPNMTRGSLFDNRLYTPSSFDHIAQGKKLASSSCVSTSIQNKQTLTRRRLSVDNRPPQSSSSLDHNSQGKKLASLSCAPPAPSIQYNKQTLTRRRLSFDNRPPQSSSLDPNTQAKKLASSSIIDSNVQNKQTLARRRLSFDHRPPLPSSFRDNSPQSKKIVSIHRKQTPTRRRLSIDHKPPMPSSPLLKHRTSSNPRESTLKPPLSSSSNKNSTSQIPLLNKFSKPPHTTSYKDVIIGKQHGTGLYDKTVNMNKHAIANIDAHDEGDQELVIEDDHDEDLSETINIDEYLKAAESSPLYVVENQQIIITEPPEDQQQLILVDQETSIIKNHKELEEIKNLEPSYNESTHQEEEKEKVTEESHETSLKPLDDCQQKKELDLNTHQEEKEESEGRNNKGKDKTSTTTMAFAKAYPHLVHYKKESLVSSNDVIEETASKLRSDQRKNRVKALASAFETVISLQDPK